MHTHTYNKGYIQILYRLVYRYNDKYVKTSLSFLR